jgi:hypothetical protein
MLLITILVLSSPVLANEVTIVDAKLTRGHSGNWHASVTLKHNDAGWEHYADEWRVVDVEGHVLGTRVLYHPHVNEQPFTRSLGNIRIPDGTDKVYVEAHDKVHGWSEQKFEVSLK